MIGRFVWLVGGLIVALHVAAGAAAAQEGAKLTEEQRKALKAESDRVWGEAERLDREGKVLEAVVVGERALVVNRRLLGEVHPEIAGDHVWLAVRYESLDDLAAARRHRQESLRVETLLHEAGHWHIAEARVYLSDVEQLQKLKAEDRERLREASATMNKVASLHAKGAYAEGIPLAEQALGIRRSILGEKHQAVATAASWLGSNYLEVGDFAKAEQFYRLAMQINKEVFRATRPRQATDLSNLAILYRRSGDLAKAEPLYREAAEIRRRVLGEKHPEYALSLQSLAVLMQQAGNAARTEPLLQEALEITKNALGENHPQYAMHLETLGGVYYEIGDLERARPLFEQALEIKKKTLGEAHLDYAHSLNNLASLYERLGDYAKAEPLYKQALEIRRKSVGETHSSYGESLCSLASLYEAMGQDAKVEPLYLEALAISRNYLELAAKGQSERQQLAMLRSSRDQLDQLIAVAVRRKSGERVYPEVLAWKGLVLGRQQQVRAALEARPELAPVWEEFRAVSGKLAVLSLERPAASAAAEWQAKIGELSAQKEALEARLATAGEEYRRTLTPIGLADVVAALPAGGALVDFISYVYTDRSPQKERGGLYWEQRTVAKGENLKSLREPAVLGGGLKSWEWRLAAFVVVSSKLGHPQGGSIQGSKLQEEGSGAGSVSGAEAQVQLVDLGAMEPIHKAIEQWRASQGGGTVARQAGAELREKIWRPIEERLPAGAMVILSPDGELGKLPFGALPGKGAGKYLLEEWTLAVVPTPQAIAEYSRRASAQQDGARKAPPTMLVAGNVEYDRRPAATTAQARPLASGGGRAMRGEGDAPFTPLPGTRDELAAIEELYRARFGAESLTILESTGASEEALVREAPRHSNLHLATHGYFASPRFKSALARNASELKNASFELRQVNLDLRSDQSLSGYHPGLLSGLALAGANQPNDKEDGILTAEEVGALNLGRTELVVLSACETGLGNTAGGEGLLGLQRAFQIAGTRTVVASMWSVPDQATKALMARFYENLWSRNMRKIEALREAQLWMLQHGAEQAEIRREAAARGLKEVEESGVGSRGSGVGKRLPPYYWAAWVLSGDWK